MAVLMKPPFRNALLANAYTKMVDAYERDDAGLFNPEGNPRKWGSMATHFWNGYHGLRPEQWDRASKQMIVYAAYRAGKDVRAKPSN